MGSQQAHEERLINKTYVSNRWSTHSIRSSLLNKEWKMAKAENLVVIMLMVVPEVMEDVVEEL